MVDQCLYSFQQNINPLQTQVHGTGIGDGEFFGYRVRQIGQLIDRIAVVQDVDLLGLHRQLVGHSGGNRSDLVRLPQ